MVHKTKRIAEAPDFPIIRRGFSTVTIPAGSGTGTLNVALSPALAGAATDYMALATSNDATTGMVSRALISTLTNLALAVTRIDHAHTISLFAMLTNSQSVDPHTHSVPDADVNTGTFVGAGQPAQIVDVAWIIMRRT